MNLIPDDLKHPSGGERVTHTAGDAIRGAHKALERFPDVVRRHKFIAGGAAISTSLVALAGVAIARRMRSGQTEEEAIASLTEDELHGRRVELPDEVSTNGAGPLDGETAEDEAGVTVEAVAPAAEDASRAAADGEPSDGNGTVPSESGQ
ncbi:MAG: hypothetical protein OXG95_10785 [Chloroflexi bacterium]|nr:hypothetical protein [Chloroflexota bacterium]